MTRTAILAALLALTACTSTTTEAGTPPPTEATTAEATVPPTTTPAPAPTEATVPPPPTYTPWADVDPYTSVYFIELEDTTLAAEQGQQRLYGLGVGVCQHLDLGRGIAEELTGLIDDARLTPGDAGQIVGAAVSDLCPHHGALVEQYLAENR